jgi:hypothetical protein
MGRPPGPSLTAFGNVLAAKATATAGRNRLGFGEADQHDLAIVPTQAQHCVRRTLARIGDLIRRLEVAVFVHDLPLTVLPTVGVR